MHHVDACAAARLVVCSACCQLVGCQVLRHLGILPAGNKESRRQVWLPRMRQGDACWVGEVSLTGSRIGWQCSPCVPAPYLNPRRRWKRQTLIWRRRFESVQSQGQPTTTSVTAKSRTKSPLDLIPRTQSCLSGPLSTLLSIMLYRSGGRGFVLDVVFRRVWLCRGGILSVPRYTVAWTAPPSVLGIPDCATPTDHRRHHQVA